MATVEAPETPPHLTSPRWGEELNCDRPIRGARFVDEVAGGIHGVCEDRWTSSVPRRTIASAIAEDPVAQLKKKPQKPRRSDGEPEPRAHALETDPRFLRRIEKARTSLRAGRGVRLENLDRE